MKTSLPCMGVARVLALAALLGAHSFVGAVSLTDQPVFATSNVPGNLALALSVEWPTASRTAHTANYSSASKYLGYFDPNKCYTYTKVATANPVIPANGDGVFRGDSSYFKPTGVATGRKCIGGALDAMWSGNFLNWAATATIDPFRWAMTGGRRVVDEVLDGVETTILEKGWHGDRGLFDDRDLTPSEIAGATPYDAASRLTVQVRNRGFAMRLVTTAGALRADYFNSKDLSGTPVTVSNDSADHDWGSDRPVAGINADGFSARFTGSYVAPETGDYIFRVRGDDGVRLWINGTQVIDGWKDQGPTDYDATVPLTAGQPFDVKIEYYENAGGAVMQFGWRRPSAASVKSFTSDIGASSSADFTMRNQVCDPSAPGGVESNCKPYGSNWKPEGLIQQYSQRMRFSAFGYLNDSSDQRDGGVMRARQKFVGPKEPVPGLPDTTNPENEWDPTTGRFIQNPNKEDADATAGLTGIAISDSGVVNYLNKFGQLLPGNYKDYDPVSEMYYAVLRYFKYLGNVSAWSNLNSTDTATKRRLLDGFPVITDWKKKDPIQYSCQRNFVLGIGDIYTHVDKNVPGNSDFRVREPGAPAEFTSDPDLVNAVTATNKVGALQGVGSIGSSSDYSGRNNSAYIAGLAYDANTVDIRPDDTGSPQTKGMQTVQTYWVDVLEQDFQANNQFYLAAKFGGLKVPDDFKPYAAEPPDIQQNWWATSADTLTDTRTNTVQPRPDNYFTAGRPDTMVDGLTRAFASIANAIKAYTTSFSLSTVQVSSSGADSYASQYDSDGWTGVLSAGKMTFGKDGSPSVEARWTSAGAFEAQLAGTGWDVKRRVVTWDPVARVGQPFRKETLTTAQFDLLNTPWDSPNGDDRADFLNYLRGDRSKEKTSALSALPYRHRNALLGDIVDAKVTPVAPPMMRYSESINPGYAAFKAAKASRTTMVYVGANDGMLHAFKGGLTDASAGTEQFAYVPSALYAGPTGQSTLNGLVQLGNPNYEHHFYVNATPQAFDIDFNNAGGSFTTTSKDNSDWRSVLIGGLGKGGKSFFAIDITDPDSMTTEAIVKDKVLWEFTDTTMGYSYGAPNVIKTKKYGWVVVLTSGYNNSNGYGYLYLVNPRNGALLESVRTPTASAGLAQATAYIKDFTDGTADAIYAGDLDGQVWRFDVSAERSATGSYPAPVKLASVTDGASNPQPITSQPLVEIDPKSRKRYVMFGTGQLLDTVDIKSGAAQAFYAFEDGTANLFGATTGMSRSGLKSITNADLVSTTPIDFTGKRGWYIELGSTDNVGWRMISNATSHDGVVAFASLLTTGTACSPAGQSNIYAIKFGSGASALVTPEGTPMALAFNAAAITDLKFLGVDGKAQVIGGDVEGKRRKFDTKPGGDPGVRLLNWREVPTID
ncbi:PilC/PilY family type IV pilus protein [Variovorax sp. J22P240]|uniref:PilC/PilY family type IV pilus protein n=1 Tax=Variovorax sp. J22P240 TaxID=3053514 RepID=UPI002576E937|nr:PilC/PilY family type IV pilus protein [Variovorax sp. J22P240]MDM0001147.1 PilC/PilY family type IV pilus protein [Variovorax sp. J22P240]